MYFGALLVLSLLGLPGQKIAVLEISAKIGIDQARADMFTEFLQSEMRSRGHDVIGKSEIEAVLGVEKMKEALSCDEGACLAEIGGALGVDEIVHGAIAQMGPYLLITLKRTDHKNARVLRQATRKLSDAGDKELLDAIDSLVDELFRPATAGLRSAAQDKTAGAVPAPTVQKPGPAPAAPSTKTPVVERAQVTDATPAAPAPRVDATVSAAPRRPVGLLPIALWAAGGVGLVVGGVYEWQAYRHHSKATDVDRFGRQIQAQKARKDQNVARIAAAAGGATVLVGLGAWLLFPGSPEPRVVPTTDGRAVGLLVTSSF